MNYLIVGASSGLGRELSYVYAKNKNNLIICSRKEDDLNALKSDIENRYKVKVTVLVLDLTSQDEVEKKLTSNKELLKEIDGVLFPVGMMFEKDTINLDVKKIHELISANFSSVAFIASKFISQKNEGTITMFGSVSGYLGRNLNPYYAAAKRSLESYFESMVFVNTKRNIKIQLYILGYLETNLSFGKKLILPKGSIKKLSEKVYKNKNKKSKKFFFPAWWTVIIFLLKIIPFSFFSIFNDIKKKND